VLALGPREVRRVDGEQVRVRDVGEVESEQAVRVPVGEPVGDAAADVAARGDEAVVGRARS
jgi:hypothetical protein